MARAAVEALPLGLKVIFNPFRADALDLARTARFDVVVHFLDVPIDTRPSRELANGCPLRQLMVTDVLVGRVH